MRINPFPVIWREDPVQIAMPVKAWDEDKAYAERFIAECCDSGDAP